MAPKAADVDMIPEMIVANKKIQPVFWMAIPFDFNNANHAAHCKLDRIITDTIFALIIPLTVMGADRSVCRVLFSISSVSESMDMLPATKAGKNINIGNNTE